MIGEFAERAAPVFLVDLADLASDTSASLRAKALRHLFQGLHQAKGRLVEHQRALLPRKGEEFFLPPLFLGEEALETKTITGK